MRFVNSFFLNSRILLDKLSFDFGNNSIYLVSLKRKPTFSNFYLNYIINSQNINNNGGCANLHIKKKGFVKSKLGSLFFFNMYKGTSVLRVNNSLFSHLSKNLNFVYLDSYKIRVATSSLFSDIETRFKSLYIPSYESTIKEFNFIYLNIIPFYLNIFFVVLFGFIESFFLLEILIPNLFGEVYNLWFLGFLKNSYWVFSDKPYFYFLSPLLKFFLVVFIYLSISVWLFSLSVYAFLLGFRNLYQLVYTFDGQYDLDNREFKSLYLYLGSPFKYLYIYLCLFYNYLGVVLLYDFFWFCFNIISLFFYFLLQKINLLYLVVMFLFILGNIIIIFYLNNLEKYRVGKLEHKKYIHFLMRYLSKFSFSYFNIFFFLRSRLFYNKLESFKNVNNISNKNYLYSSDIIYGGRTLNKILNIYLKFYLNLFVFFCLFFPVFFLFFFFFSGIVSFLTINLEFSVINIFFLDLFFKLLANLFVIIYHIYDYIFIFFIFLIFFIKIVFFKFLIFFFDLYVFFSEKKILVDFIDLSFKGFNLNNKSYNFFSYFFDNNAFLLVLKVFLSFFCFFIIIIIIIFINNILKSSFEYLVGGWYLTRINNKISSEVLLNKNKNKSRKIESNELKKIPMFQYFDGEAFLYRNLLNFFFNLYKFIKRIFQKILNLILKFLKNIKVIRGYFFYSFKKNKIPNSFLFLLNLKNFSLLGNIKLLVWDIKSFNSLNYNIVLRKLDFLNHLNNSFIFLLYKMFTYSKILFILKSKDLYFYYLESSKFSESFLKNKNKLVELEYFKQIYGPNSDLLSIKDHKGLEKK